MAFVVFHLACTLAMVALLVFTPEPGGRSAAIFPPWYTSGQVMSAVVAADGRLVRFGAAPWIAVVAPSASVARFQMRLSDLGALAFINPQIVGGCDPVSPRPVFKR